MTTETQQTPTESVVAEEAQHYDFSDFVQGQADCRDGLPHQEGKGRSYDAGYSAQYQLEQIVSGMSGAHHG